jgi:putative membrane protein
LDNPPNQSEPESNPVPQPLPPGYPPGYAGIVYQRPPRSLHVATIVVELMAWLRSMIPIIGVAVVLRLLGQDPDLIEIMIAIFGGLRIAAGVVRYLTVQYWVENETLIIKTGLLNVQRRTIPVGKIQNINLKRNLIHRMLGVAEVKIETASGMGAEGELSVVDLVEAERLRHELGGLASATSTAVQLASTPDNAIYKASLGRLLLMGATGNRLGTLIGSVAALFFVFGGPRRFADIAQSAARELRLDTATEWVLVAIAMVVVGWLLSMGWAVMTFFNFTVDRAGERLRRTYGLLTRHESYFPQKRLQMVRVASGPVQRLFKLARINAETAGSFQDQENAGSSVLAPVVKRDEVAGICASVLPGFAFEQINWQPVHRRAIRRATIRFTILLCMCITILAANLGWEALWGALAAPLLAWPMGVAYWRSLGWWYDEHVIAVRSGILTRTVKIIPRPRVQTAMVSQNPIQRRLGLARLRIQTASGLSGDASVPDIGFEVAVSIQDAISQVKS